MAAKLTDSQVQANLSKIPGWTLENGEITRTFKLGTFPAALVFVSAVGHLAESANHHPDILIKYKNVKLSLATHDAGGLTDKDFALATRINDLVREAESKV